MKKLDKRRAVAETSPRRPWRLPVLCALVFVAYSNSFQSGLVFDNASVIGEDPRIREATPRNVESILTSPYWRGNTTRATAQYRPLTTISYMLNYAVLGDGPSPAGYHWVNLFLHEINIALVYALGILIFGESAPALVLAAIWGLHPLLSESVTSIVGRADLLAAFGVLAGLLCHVKAASQTGRRRRLWLVALGAAATVGIFCKENGAVLPGIMLLYDVTWADRDRWRRRALAYAAVVLPFAAFLYLRSGLHMQLLIDPTENPLIQVGFWTARLTALKVVGSLLWLFLWPVRLSADYSYDAVPLFGWRLLDWAVPLGAVLTAALLAVRWGGMGKPLRFFLLFFLVALSPTSNLIMLIGSIKAERFMYLPSIGLAGCVIAAYLALRRPVSPRLVCAALGLVCLAFTARTYARNVDWQDDLSLWTSAVDVCPEAARPHYNLAIQLERFRDRLPDAVAEYRAALRIEPEFAEARSNLASDLARMPGRLPEAIAEFQAALRLRPDQAAIHLNLANALAQTPEGPAAAIAEYQEVLRLQPERADVHYNLGNALVGMPGRQQEAVAQYQAAVRYQPNFFEAHVNLANTLARMPGRLPEAIAEYEAALKIRPDPQLQQTVDRLRAIQIR